MSNRNRIFYCKTLNVLQHQLLFLWIVEIQKTGGKCFSRTEMYHRSASVVHGRRYWTLQLLYSVGRISFRKRYVEVTMNFPENFCRATTDKLFRSRAVYNKTTYDMYITYYIRVFVCLVSIFWRSRHDYDNTRTT